MANDFDRILDECIDRLGRGVSLEQCLTDNPEHAKQLEPLLRAMAQTKAAYSFTPSVDTKRSARLRFYKALDKKRRPPVWRRIGAWQPVWSVVASILLVLIIFFAVLRSPVVTISIPPDEPIPSGITVMSVTAPSHDGNFVFLVSDEENAIGDFNSLFVTIEKVALLKSGDTEALVEFVPEVKEFDLTLLPGEKTQELWRGKIPEGTYSKVFAYVTEVKGVLKATGEEINVKLPSGKLQLACSFQVSADNITNFTFDITVVKTGQAGAGKYLLKPQASESGITQALQPTKGKVKRNPN
jgi:hypothetical protein